MPVGGNFMIFTNYDALEPGNIVTQNKAQSTEKSIM